MRLHKLLACSSRHLRPATHLEALHVQLLWCVFDWHLTSCQQLAKECVQLGLVLHANKLVHDFALAQAKHSGQAGEGEQAWSEMSQVVLFVAEFFGCEVPCDPQCLCQLWVLVCVQLGQQHLATLSIHLPNMYAATSPKTRAGVRTGALLASIQTATCTTICSSTGVS